MIEFVLVAVLLVVLALGILLWPYIRKGGRAAQTTHRQLNAAIYREQLAKLKQDLAENMIPAEDYAKAEAELQRRLIDDAVDDTTPSSFNTPQKTVLGLVILLPLIAAAIYLGLGTPSALRPAVAQDAASQPDVERMVAGLAQRLEKQPGDLKGWSMLARSYKVLGKPLEAEKAFDHAGTYVDNDAQLLADYADVAATNAKGDFSGKPALLIQKALRVDPNNTMALWLAGSAAFNSHDYQQALSVWDRLSKKFQPDSDDAKMLQSAMDDARAKMGHPVASSAAATPATSISGTVELDPRYKAGAADTVMIIARAPGERMPVAVIRARATSLPLPFTLDDSSAMNPEVHLSTLSTVTVEARISKSGMAQAEPGDLLSSVQTVKLGEQKLRLVVDAVRP